MSLKLCTASWRIALLFGRIARMRSACGLLRTMDVARSVVCVCVSMCAQHTGELCKNGWTDREAVRGLTHVDPRNHVFDEGQDRTNQFAATTDDKTAMRHFATSLWTVVRVWCCCRTRQCVRRAYRLRVEAVVLASVVFKRLHRCRVRKCLDRSISRSRSFAKRVVIAVRLGCVTSAGCSVFTTTYV